jgi:hypothetical protein
VQLAKVSIHDWLGRRHGTRLTDVCQKTVLRLVHVHVAVGVAFMLGTHAVKAAQMGGFAGLG